MKKSTKTSTEVWSNYFWKQTAPPGSMECHTTPVHTCTSPLRQTSCKSPAKFSAGICNSDTHLSGLRVGFTCSFLKLWCHFTDCKLVRKHPDCYWLNSFKNSEIINQVFRKTGEVAINTPQRSCISAFYASYCLCLLAVLSEVRRTKWPSFHPTEGFQKDQTVNQQYLPNRDCEKSLNCNKRLTNISKIIFLA